MAQVKQYLSKSVLISAIQWTGENFGEIVTLSRFCPELLYIDKNVKDPPLAIILGKKESLANVGDYIVIGSDRKLTIWKKAKFEDSFYEFSVEVVS